MLEYIGLTHCVPNQRCIVDVRTNVSFATGSPDMKRLKFPMGDNSKLFARKVPIFYCNHLAKYNCSVFV